LPRFRQSSAAHCHGETTDNLTNRPENKGLPERNDNCSVLLHTDFSRRRELHVYQPQAKKIDFAGEMIFNQQR